MKAAKLWIWLSVLASLAGWSLSAVGQLNRVGYAIFFGLVAVVFFFCRGKIHFNFPPPRKLLRRFRRPLPLAFAVLALLVLVGGVMYPPSNYTGLNYRLARTLQWLAHDGWFWIHTPVFRMNDRACGIEWLSAPLLLFAKSDRALFLLNFIPFLLLPGLVFTVFTRLGVRARVAWQWMWLVPTGYDFLLQSAGIANDTFPAVYALAMLAFGCRAWVSRQPADLWFAILAGALLTGAKASNIPLLLPCAVLIFPLLPILLRRWKTTALVLLLGAAVSFLTTAALNIYYIHDWSGLSIERAGMNMKNPLVGIWGNTLLLLLNNFLPPLFPLAGWWNTHILSILPQFLTVPMLANFEPGFHLLPEVPTEDWAGFGFGCCLLLLVSIPAAFWLRRSAGNNSLPLAIPEKLRLCVLAAPWIALLVYTLKSGMVTPHRIIAPYYPLLLLALLQGAGQSQVVRRWWWRGLVGGVLALALVVLVISPDRPLWPAKTILSKVVTAHPEQRATARALQVYAVYAQRPDALAAVRELLPPGVKVIGFIGTEDDCDISLWRPFGSRRVEHFLLSDSPEFMRQRVQYVIVGGFNLESHGQTIEGWQQRHGAELVSTTNALLKITEGVQPWYLVRFKPE
ncbi:MAG: hypothetical protein WCK57_09905 [Verrucomicrobiae bacterium]